MVVGATIQRRHRPPAAHLEPLLRGPTRVHGRADRGRRFHLHAGR